MSKSSEAVLSPLLSLDVPWKPEENVGTRVGAVPRSPVPLPPLAALLPSIEAQVQTRQTPGVLATAIGARGVFGNTWIPSTPHGLHAVSIGRHTAADLVLPGDGELSLRHLLLITQHWEGVVRFMLRDLRSSSGSFVEGEGPHGEALSHIVHDEPLVLRAASWMLVLAPTGVSAAGGPACPLESSVASGAARILSFTGEHPEVGRPTTPGRAALRWEDADAGLRARALMDVGDALAGFLVVREGAQVLRAPVGYGALERGVLIGRDGRCDVISNLTGTSRVHCVLFASPWTRELCVADAGSSNKTYVNGRPVRCAALAPDTAIHLGGKRLTLEWTPNAAGAC